ncbi:MAG: PKD domain-containing protein [Bacteroidia bacterium]
MRSIKFSLLIAALLLTTAAQAQIVWEKYWGGPYDDGCEVRNTRDGGMIVMASYGIDSWMLRMDANGDTLWTYRVRTPIDICAVTETFDGGFLATGVTRYANRDVVAWKFNYRGDSLWMKIYPDSIHTEGNYSVKELPDSGFIVTGYTSDANYDMLAMRIDSVGNVKWQQAYGGSDFEGGTMPSTTADGGFVFTTTLSGVGTSKIWVVRVDSLGDTVWTRTFSEPSNIGGPVPTVMADGSIWIIGWIEHSGDYDNYVLRLNANGALIWKREYPGLGFENRSARGIIADRFGGYSFASSVDEAYGPSEGHDIALYRVDSNGVVTRLHRLGHGGDDMARYFEQAANGDYLFVGFTTSFTTFGQQAYLARLNPSGCGEFLYDFTTQLHQRSCPGDTLLLDAGPGFLSYLWSDGDTNRIRPVLVSDTFYVEAHDAQGCPNYSNIVIVEVDAMPTFAWTLSSLTVDFQATGLPNAVYDWDFGDGGAASGSSPTHTFPATGTYWVCLTYTIDTCPAVNICDSVSVMGPNAAGDAMVDGIRLYPNPANQWVRLENTTGEELVLNLMDGLGRVLWTGTVGGFQRTDLDTREWAAGIYRLRFVGDVGLAGRCNLVIAR